MTACHLCGTRTGQHGFSWDKDKWPQPKQKNSGILYIPFELAPTEEDQDRITGLLNSFTDPPEVRFGNAPDTN